MIYFRCFLIFFLVGVLVSKKTFSNSLMNDYHKEALLGELSIGDYHGPGDYMIRRDVNSRRVYFLDEKFFEQVSDMPFDDGLNFLSREFFPQMRLVHRCPNEIFKNHISYIRYLYRLLTVSYLFEMMKLYNMTLHQFGAERHTCTLAWNETFGRCRPKTSEMTKFIKRIKPVYLKALDRAKFSGKKKREIKKWVGKVDGPVQRQVMNWCKEAGCRKLDLQTIRKSIVNICNRDLKLILNVCSERDSLYGISYIEEASRLLKTSHIMNVVGNDGYGIGCMDRYVRIFKNSENPYPWLVDVYKSVYKKNLDNNERYLEGNLFLPGTLKEFDDKGLTDFLFVIATPAPVPVLTPRPTPVSTPIVKVTPTPTPTPVRVQKRKVLVARPTPKPAPRISQFEKAVERRRAQNLKKVDVDMELFAGDFLFKSVIRKKLGKSLHKYQRRKALQDMKHFDKLGSKKGPVRLMFLKFLIDNGEHQGLYNIQAVIGTRFWCLNDIDGMKKPQYIKLENTERTNYKWTISILKQPAKIKNKK
ncbi:MAG: hypothetical protein KAQ98_02720 [Bacteriovoracaceae bacterium]|nr:hypothetical protein [Bacteriovoracaceae bacterium]